MNKKRIGIIGTGSISKVHIKSYQALSEMAEVVACCDLDGEKARAYAQENGIPAVYTDCAEMMAKERLDCVSVCTWNAAHASCAITALRGGAHVLCEKPMAMNTKEALAMEAAARESGKLLQIGFVRRFGRDAEAIRHLTEAGVMGDIYYARTHFLRRSDGPGGWFGDRAYAGGGPLIDLGVHMIDLVRYLAGNPLPVSVVGATFSGLDGKRALDGKADWNASPVHTSFRHDVEDLAVATIRFDSGLVLQVETSYTLNIGTPGKNVELFGTKAGVKIGPGIEYCTTQAGMYVNSKPTMEADFSFRDAFLAEVRGFLEATEGAECRATARDGVVMMQMIDAIYESARTGRQVMIG